jgi:hypothetical protein
MGTAQQARLVNHGAQAQLVGLEPALLPQLASGGGAHVLAAPHVPPEPVPEPAKAVFVARGAQQQDALARTHEAECDRHSPDALTHEAQHNP